MTDPIYQNADYARQVMYNQTAGLHDAKIQKAFMKKEGLKGLTIFSIESYDRYIEFAKKYKQDEASLDVDTMEANKSTEPVPPSDSSLAADASPVLDSFFEGDNSDTTPEIPF